MSAYGKPQPPQLHGYDPGRPFPEGAFSYTGPVYTSQAAVPSATAAPVFQNASQMTQMAYPPNQPRASYDEQSGPYLNVGSTPIPEVTSFSPTRGIKGARFYVSITTLYELATPTEAVFFLMFGQRKCPASLTKMSQQGGACQYSVGTDIPHQASTNWQASQVPVYLFMETHDGDIIAKVDVGEFTYLDGGAQSGSNVAQESSRKRKISSESAELMKSPAKRSSSQHLRSKEEYGAYGYPPGDGSSSYSPYLQANNNSYNNSNTSLIPPYNRSAGGYQAQPSSRHLGYGYATSSAGSPPMIKAQSPQVAGWGPSYSSVSANMSRSPGVPSNASTTRPSLTSLPSPSAANPPLIRTSTIQQTPSPATTPHGGHPAQHFNAYSLYPHKAKLEINGDLNSMAQGWSQEEWDSRRRLVLFRRSQSGSTITTTFQPVALEDKTQTSVCISCILWEEKNEYYVTSVDTIYLLEKLVAARFTVEEKNRIRRNLEGFRPLTVSKAKPDSEEFFKVIMAFPAPKPRNIEKDVKVFNWKDLAPALKKIIGKYSASPSSTLPPAPALLTPVSSTGYVTEGSSAALSYASDHHGAVSPRSISGSTTSTAYTSNIPARVISPHNQKSMSLQGGPPDLRVAVPQNPHENHWQGGPHHMPTPQQYQQLGGQSGRSPWDMSNYLENPASAGGTSSQTQQNLNYQTPRNIPDSVIPVGDARLARSLSSQQQQQSHQMPRT